MDDAKARSCQPVIIIKIMIQGVATLRSGLCDPAVDKVSYEKRFGL